MWPAAASSLPSGLLSTSTIPSVCLIALLANMMAVTLTKLDKMTKEQLRKYLLDEYQEHAYTRWTKPEIRQRILELQSHAAGVPMEELHRGTTLTATQAAIREVRKAAKKKAELVQLCERTYGMEVNKNDTISILEARVIKVIYDTTEPEAGDVIGFGKNGHLLYRDMLAPEHENYATWVMTTAHENPTTGCDPRLYRLAKWLEGQNMEGRKAKIGNSMSHPTEKKTSQGYPKDGGMTRMPPTTAASSSSDQLGGSTGSQDRGIGRGVGRDPHGAQGDQRRQGAEASRSPDDGRGDDRREPVGCLLLQDRNTTSDYQDAEGVNAYAAGVAMDGWPGHNLSASQLLRQQLRRSPTKVEQLSEQQARSLEAKASSIVPGLFQDLVGHQRPMLMQYSERPDTALIQAVQERAKSSDSAWHAGPWNGCDLLTKEGLRLLLEHIRRDQPQHVWLAPPSGAHSPLTNMHQRTEAQRDALQQKRQEALRRYVACACVVHLCIQLGIHVSWEMPEQSQAWRLPLLSKLRDKYGLYTAVTKGCAVNRRNEPGGPLIRQGWRLLTTHKALSESLNLGCRCHKQYQHGNCTGSPKQAELPYTKEYAQRVARHLHQELSHDATIRECAGSTMLVSGFGEGEFCTCGEVCMPRVAQECANCMKGRTHVQLQANDEVMMTSSNRPEDGDVGDEVVHEDRSGDAYVTADGCREVFAEEQTQKVEAQAQELMRQQQYQHKHCEGLIHMLPQSRHKNQRSVIQEERPRYLTFGLYAYGNQYGVTKCTLKFPKTCQYLLQYLQHWAREPLECTSFVINDNGTLKLHKDHHNSPGYPNYLMGITAYQKGGLWIEGPPRNSRQETRAKVLPNGQSCLGHVEETRHRMVQFDAKLWHATEAWHGNRAVLSAFVSRGWDVEGLCDN